jgi:hypothetical protein
MNVRNPTYYQTYVGALKKLCWFGFLQPLINETHFDIEIKVLYTLKKQKTS